jgi:hypothetical protein
MDAACKRYVDDEVLKDADVHEKDSKMA